MTAHSDHAAVLNATYLEVIDLALTFPVGDYRDGIIRAAQHVLAKANTIHREAARG